MQEIICVRGPRDSGKTSAIRRFIEQHGESLPLSPRDVRRVLTVDMAGKTYRLGVATGGDSRAILQGHFNYFDECACKIVVCAARSRGETIDFVREQAAKRRTGLDEIPTSKVKGASQMEQESEEARIAILIGLSIP